MDKGSLTKLGAGACGSALYDLTHELSITLTHKGNDVWKGSWVKIIFDKGNSVMCNFKNLSSNNDITATCATKTTHFEFPFWYVVELVW